MTKQRMVFLLFLITALVVPVASFAATSDTSFKEVYEFIYSIATGYFARGVAIAGGIVGLIAGALAGKFMPAMAGITLGFAGAWGPKIVTSFFSGATI